MSKKVNVSAIKEFASQNEHTIFTTKSRKKDFKVAISDGYLVVTPQSSGKTRKESDKVLTCTIDHFNKTQSFQSKDYHEITFNSVYVLTLIQKYLL